MPRLFLIRRNLESFLGPMTVDEMRREYKRMNFGLQDEICGHAGDWITFDDVPKMKKKYPELAKFVTSEMLAGWGISEHPSRRLGAEETKQIPIKGEGKDLGLALTFLFIALIAFFAAIYLANSSRFSGKLKKEGAPDVREAAAFVETGDQAGFSAYMGQNHKEILSQTNRSKKHLAEWLPYLRNHAFRKGGQLLGISPKVLRGTGASAAPIDCSKRVWRKRWKGSVKNWSSLISGKKLPRAHWARLLAWDPHWIRRREHRGWNEPQNYYIGCLQMASAALNEVTMDSQALPGSNVTDWERSGVGPLRARLAWLLAASQDGSARQSGKSRATLTVLDVWTCFENARSTTELSQCSQGLSVADGVKSYVSERRGWALISMLATGRTKNPSDVAEVLNETVPKLQRTDFFTRFDYRPELKFVKMVTSGRVAVDEAAEEVGEDFPEVYLSH